MASQPVEACPHDPAPRPQQYEDDFTCHVYTTGTPKTDRTGTGTRSVFGYQMRLDLNEAFRWSPPRRGAPKSIIHELLWFLTGSSNNNWLKERGVTIWDEWAAPTATWAPLHGVRWRSWPTPGRRGHIDQIAEVGDAQDQPDSRRIIVSAWNVAELNKMALMPCHAFFQFYVAHRRWASPANQLPALPAQRRHLPRRAVQHRQSYALLTHMVAQQCNLAVGDFIWTGGDCHIYSNHDEQVELQLSRTPYPYPVLNIQAQARLDP